MLIKRLDEVNDPLIMGYKAYNISKIENTLKDYGYLIPESLIITTEVFDECVLEEGIDTEKFKSKYLNEIYNVIVQNFGNKKLVVRSSSTFEDTPIYSMSGVYDSFLNVDTKEKLYKAIIKCYKSIFKKEVTDMIMYTKKRQSQAKMAILIHEMIPNITTAGVCFTKNPVTNKDEYIIEYAESGVNVVSGRGEVKREIIDKKKPSGKGLDGVLEMSQILSNKFNMPLDIEWGIANNQLYCFQCRPIISCNVSPPIIKEEIPCYKGIPVSPGIAFGKLSIDSFDSVTILNNYDDFFRNIKKINAALLTEGGILSHQANLLRENNIPAVLISDKGIDLKKYNSSFFVINGFTGEVFIYEEVSAKQKSELFNYFIDYLKINPQVQNKYCIDRIESINQKEAVYMGIDEQFIKEQIAQLNFNSYKTRQRIYNCDLIENNLMGSNSFDCIRIQDDINVRIQFKKILINDDDFREELQTVLFFENITEAKSFLRKIGLEITQEQYRDITVYLNENIKLNFIQWPNSPVFLGIEFTEYHKFFDLVKSIDGLTEPQALTGGQIFEKLDLNRIFTK
jgi:phosphoenolpyruvate synthase/pyruvate phosphate dikinase